MAEITSMVIDELADKQIVDVETLPSPGWRLAISQRWVDTGRFRGMVYDATLADPSGAIPYRLFSWLSMDGVLETYCAWLNDPKRNLVPTASALRAMVAAETAP